MHATRFLASILIVGCFHGDTDLSSSTTKTSTTADDTTGTSTGDSSTTTAAPCDDDPACGPGETPETCPEQYNDCGDGILTADEAFNNGDQNRLLMAFARAPTTIIGIG